MANAMNYALPVRRGAARLALIGRDIAAGLMSTSRFIVTFVGCVTLVGAAAIISNDAARGRLLEHGPAVIGHWLVPAAAHAAESPAAPAPEQAAAAVAEVDPQQRHLTQYLSRRYRVAEEATRRLVAAAFDSGREQGLDPLLILAVMAIESSMNPFAESPMGAQGLMQVMTRVHSDKFEMHGGEHAALDPIANIKVGSAILRDLVRRGGSVERGLQLYVGAGNMESDGGYGARVLGERSRLALAATGKVDSALSAGLRADVQRSESKITS